MVMIDFSNLDGERFEALCEDLFKAMGHNDPPPERSGRGSDGGRDLIVTEHRYSGILGAPRRFRWLVECKNFAKKSVQPKDVGSIVDKIILHKADGYLLVTSTIPSTNVEKTIAAIDRNPRDRYEATYWANSRLVEELHKHRSVHEKYFGASGAETSVFTHWSKFNPFMELFPYEEDFAEYFFGRASDIRNVVEKVYQKNLVLLYGASGVGKTSLIQAGVLPVLRKEGFKVAKVKVEPNLKASDLIEAILTIAPVKLSDEFVSLGGSNGPARALQQIAQHLFKNGHRLVVILDQFESIFQDSPHALAKLGAFFLEASSLAQKYRSVAFLFSLRSEYLDNLGIWTSEHQISTIWGNSYPVEKLSVSEATEVLNKAAEVVNASFSHEAIQVIVGDVSSLDGGRVYPPNLQIVASKVFDTARKQTGLEASSTLSINVEHYEAVGKSKGILESFLDEKLAEFGPDRELAQSVLLTLVSATGRRFSLSDQELSEKLSLSVKALDRIIEKLIQARLLKPTDRGRVYELVHDVLATKVLETTHEDIRKAKAAKEAFELAVTTWKTDRVFESSQRLDWFYSYRHNLNIGADELLFVLVSEGKDNSDGFFALFDGGLTKTEKRKRRLNWINFVSAVVCIQTLDTVLRASDNPESDEALVSVLATDLCSASNFDVQRELVVRLENSTRSSMSLLYRLCYQSSFIPTSAALSYLEGIILGELPSEIKKVIGYRILEHHRTKSTVPTDLLTDKEFQDITFGYLKDPLVAQLSMSNMQQFERYKIGLLDLLHNQNPDRAVRFLWDMVNLVHLDEYGASQVDIEVLKRLLVYDPQRTIKEVSRALDREKPYYPSSTVSLLEALEAPETDDLLTKDLERYVQKLKGGSKRWRGSSLPYWRESIRKTITVLGKRRLEASVPHLVAIVWGDEPEKVTLDCIDALASIGGDAAAKTLAELQYHKSQRVRSRASKCLTNLEQKRN